MYKRLLYLIPLLVLAGVVLHHMSKKRHQVSLEAVNPTAAYDTWIHWKKNHKKYYASPALEKYRFGVFTNNLEQISIYHEMFEAGKSQFDVDINNFADLTLSEFKNRYLSLKSTKKNAIKHKSTIKAPKGIPDTVDWSTQNVVTPVKNQGQCGSCWAFSTTGTLEGLYAITQGTLLSFSEQQLVDCSSSYGNEGCNGGLMSQALQYTQAQGIELESSYSYAGVDQQCSYDATKVVFKNTGQVAVSPNDEVALRTAVAQQPVSVAVDAANIAWQFYSGGIVSSFCGTNLDHGVLTVGYGIDAKKGIPFWKVKNSWGPTWGNQGYIFIKRIPNDTGKGTCGIQMDAVYATGVAK